MRTSKKSLSAVLAIIMTISLLFGGVTGFAADTGTTVTSTNSTVTSVTYGVYDVGNEAELRAALVNANATTINLTSNISLADYLQINRAVTINGNGKMLNKGVAIEASNVTLRGLAITPSKFYTDQEFDWYYGVMVGDVQGVQIVDSIIDGTPVTDKDPVGISDKTGSANTQFTVSNTSIKNGWVGILVDSKGTVATLSQNPISDQKHAISVAEANVSKLTITGNMIISPKKLSDGITSGDGITLPSGTPQAQRVAIQEANNFFTMGTGLSVVNDGQMEVVVNIPTEFKVDEATNFTVGTIANKELGKKVRATFNMPADATIEYQEGENWLPLPNGEFGPAEGFPLGDITTSFRATFSQGGAKTVTLSFKTAEVVPVELAKKEININVGSPEISNVSIKSSNPDATRARVGDTITLTFTSTQEMFQMSSFMIHENIPTSFTSKAFGDVYQNVATYVMEDTDTEGTIRFKINVKNAVGLVSKEIVETTDGSLVTFTKSPEILSVSISSSNADKTKAKVGDTVTVSFKTTQPMLMLGDFKINGNSPDNFVSTRSGDLWTNNATYVIQDTDPVGKVSFKINAKNSEGNTVTTETTTDGSSVTVDNGLSTVTMSKAVATGNFDNTANVNAFMTAIWGGESGNDEGTVVTEVYVNKILSVNGSTLTVDGYKVTDGMKHFIDTNYGGNSVPVKVAFAAGNTPKDMTTDANWDGSYLVWVDLGSMTHGTKDFTVAMKNGTSAAYSINTSLTGPLSSIAITTQPKLNYIVGESLDINGMVVTGTYADGTTHELTVTAENVTGFNSASPATSQTLTVTIDGQTATYAVSISAAPVVVNKTALTNAINAQFTDVTRAVYGLSASDYTVGTWTVYNDAITAAIAVETNADASQANVNAAIDAITTAKAALVFAGKANLDATIVAANTKMQANYTADSWATFTVALQDALQLPEGTNAQVVGKTLAINGALGLLVPVTTPVTPNAPNVLADDINNVIVGLNATMEYSTNNGVTWAVYNATTAPVFEGDVTVLVRVSAEGINDPSPSTTLTFTANVVVNPMTKDVANIEGNNILLVGAYAFDLNVATNASGYNLNNFIIAAKTAYANPADTNHVYFKLGDKWYDIVSDSNLESPISDLSTINGNGKFEYFNMK